MNVHMPGKHIEASALISHAQMLESRLQKNEVQFGHPKPPHLYMCRVLDPDRRGYDLGVVAMMAVTKRCISAQLLRESSTFKALGAPVEVLVLAGEDQISCAAIISLEMHHLTAPDALIVPDRSKSGPEAPALSLMSGGVKAVAPAPRVAIVAGTNQSRVISIEFSVKHKAMQLVRRNFFRGKEVCTFLEPLPPETLTDSQRKRGHAPPIKQSSRSSAPEPEDINIKPRPLVPFNPTGGVTSIRPYTMVKDGKFLTHVWISFGDGTGVRMHHAGLFPSVIQKHSESEPDNKVSLEDVLEDHLVKWQARFPPLGETKVSIVPLPKYHPSPFAPFPTWKKPEFDELVDPNADPRSDFREFHEAIVYSSGPTSDSFPTLAFYTSEDQFEGRIQGDEEVVEEKKSDSALNSIIGGLWGMISGGGGGGGDHQEEEKTEPTIRSNEPEIWDQNVPFPSINYEPISLYAGYEIHDPPRQITSCTVDPDGELAAVTDTLGRISLLDLSTKQIVRMWKGYRDTSCHWIELPQPNTKKERPVYRRKTLYLAIHSRQRKVIEIWNTRYGPKIKSIQVTREAQVIDCREISSVGFVSACYLAHSNVPFSSKNQIEKIVIKEDDIISLENPDKNRQLKRVDSIKFTQDNATRLNRLQQLLGETNVECQTIDVFKALENIKSIEDLAKALDLLASSPTLEQKMGVEGATFQQLAVSHCKAKLDAAMQEAGDKAFTNPHVQLLAFKIAYYTQIVKAYDILHRYETGEKGDGTLDVEAPSTWGLEALGWTSTYEKITKKSIDDGVVIHPSDAMRFSAFASACVAPKKWMEAVFDDKAGGYEIYLSDSSKTRKEILVRIFKPLLGDVFSFNVVNQIFEALGIKKCRGYLLKCFGEWFTTLSIKDVTKKAIFAKKAPTNRWLQSIIKDEIDANDENQKYPMESLYDYCRGEEELVRAFWLATLCRQSISQAAVNQEEKTYGKVSSEEIVGRWDSLLRQLRVCLLVSLRLHGIQLGACPISIEAVEKGGNFSVFEWLARDELAVSQKHDEIVSLEEACKMSSHSFDPSTPAGDDQARVKILQNACMSSIVNEEQRAEYLVDCDDDERLGALLLFLKAHNLGEVLVAQRALLLASKWGRQPNDLSILEDAMVALKEICVEEYKRLAYAMRIEFFQTCMRPVFRALIMGFDDVQEITPEVIAPLFQNRAWMKRFREMSLEILTMISGFTWHESERIDLFEDMVEVNDKTWPPVTECFLLQRLVGKSRKISRSSLEAHQMLIYALKLSNDISALSECIPSFYDLFTPSALFTRTVETDDMEEKQHEFMQDKILAFAQEYSGPIMDTLNLGDIEVLAELWDFDMDNVRTLFLLSMYEFGKDRFVDELVTKSASSISVQHFCEDGVEIVCRRLNHLLHVNPSEEIKEIMGNLDADMCEWIREKAENSEALVEGKADVQIGNTHLFGLRLLSLAASAQISKDDRIKIHSLIVLSGTIVKTLDEATGSSSPANQVEIPSRDVLMLGSSSASTSASGGKEEEGASSDDAESDSAEYDGLLLNSTDASNDNLLSSADEIDRSHSAGDDSSSGHAVNENFSTDDDDDDDYGDSQVTPSPSNALNRSNDSENANDSSSYYNEGATSDSGVDETGSYGASEKS